MNRGLMEATVSYTIGRVTDLNIHRRGILTREICDALEKIDEGEQPTCKDEEWDVAENIGERMKGDGAW